MERQSGGNRAVPRDCKVSSSAAAWGTLWCFVPIVMAWLGLAWLVVVLLWGVEVKVVDKGYGKQV
jgi:hypothetical protein